MPSQLMTPKEVAAELRISVLTLRRHVGNGAISVIVTGAGAKRPRYVIEADEVERFKEQRRRLQIRRSSTSAEESDTVSWWQQRRTARRAAMDSDLAKFGSNNRSRSSTGRTAIPRTGCSNDGPRSTPHREFGGLLGPKRNHRAHLEALRFFRPLVDTFG
jgi:hypothetical protein